MTWKDRRSFPKGSDSPMRIPKRGYQNTRVDWDCVPHGVDVSVKMRKLDADEMTTTDVISGMLFACFMILEEYEVDLEYTRELLDEILNFWQEDDQ